MRFAVMCPHHGYVHRGTENMTDDINNVLKKRGHMVRLFSTEYFRKDLGIGKLSDSFFEKSMIGGFSRKYIGINPNIEDIVFAIGSEEMVEIVSPAFDMLWSNGEFWCANMVKKISKRTGKPCLVFFGGGISKMMLREARMKPDIFVVLAPIMKEWLERKSPDTNTKCIPSGVDIELFKKTKPFASPDLYERPIVCSTSALIPGKNVELIIESMHELGEGTLFVTNDGPLRNKIINKGKRLLGKRFNYLGTLPFNRLPSLYSMSDVFVLASDNEPWGAVLFEAMACGCNVVAQRDSTRYFMVGNNGVLIPDVNDIKVLADAINHAYIYKDEKSLRRQAERFSWEKTVDGYEAAINEVMNGR